MVKHNQKVKLILYYYKKFSKFHNNFMQRYRDDLKTFLGLLKSRRYCFNVSRYETFISWVNFFHDGWMDCRDAFLACSLLILLCNSPNIAENEVYY